MDNIEKDIAQGYADFADDEGSIEEVETEENVVTENSTSFSFEETTNFSEMSDINRKLRAYFDGKIVRKDLTKSIKEGANVPVYVLEFLLGQYCSSDDPSIIEEGVANVKRILADNYVRPDEAQKILSLLRQRGSHTVIDKITVNLNIKKDTYEAEFSNLGIKAIPISEDYPSKFDRLLCGGIWCIVQLEYEYIEEDKNASPIHIRKLTPIQMPHVDINELKQGRKAFTKDEWISVMLRSIGMEPDTLNEREKWLLLARMLPLVENNFNLCELGPRSTGKSHLYKEISPNSILVSGGQTTVANLFYNMARKTVGLVGLWDCVAFDEVAGINFKDKDGIQIMKDYMASGSFARGKEEKSASASMVFVGNINQSVDVLLKTSSLFAPFPPEMGTDTAFLDRMHCYIPGWEIPKFRPQHFTNDYGFISDYLAEFIRELRKEQYGDALDKYFRLGKNLNQRDTIAVRKMVGGFIKLLYPDGEYTKEEVRVIAEKIGLLVADKPDSQDICFVQDGNYAAFIEEHTGKKASEGNFVTSDGTVIGRHKGIIHYTVGQRKGLGLALGYPAFVLEIRPETNEVVIGTYEESLTTVVRAKQLNFMSVEDLKEPLRVFAKIRYNHKGAWCTVERTKEDEVTCCFEEPQRAVTPGQAIVFYDGEYVLGGGTIL